MKHKMDAYLKELRCNIGGLSRCKMGMSNRASGSVSSTIHMFPGVFRSEMSTFIWILAWAFAGSILREDLWHKEPCCCRNSCADRMDKLLLLTIHSSLPGNLEMMAMIVCQRRRPPTTATVASLHHCAIQDVILEYAPKLFSVHLVLALDHQKPSVHGLICCLSNLPSLEQLHLDGGYALLWAKPDVLNRFPLRNEHQSILILDDMTSDTLDILMVCLSLLQFCPNIYTFYFSLKSTCSKTAAWFFIQDPVHILFRHLRNVTFRYYHQMGVAFDFLCFLIRQSPILERVSIVKDTDCPITKETAKRIFSRLKQRAPNTNAVFKSLLTTFNLNLDCGLALLEVYNERRFIPHYVQAYLQMG